MSHLFKVSHGKPELEHVRCPNVAHCWSIVKLPSQTETEGGIQEQKKLPLGIRLIKWHWSSCIPSFYNVTQLQLRLVITYCLFFHHTATCYHRKNSILSSISRSLFLSTSSILGFFERGFSSSIETRPPNRPKKAILGGNWFSNWKQEKIPFAQVIRRVITFRAIIIFNDTLNRVIE